MSDNPIEFAIGTAFDPMAFLAAAARARADYRCEEHGLADCRECERPEKRIEREAMEQAEAEYCGRRES